jgi:arylsulfatase A-like enzyme
MSATETRTRRSNLLVVFSDEQRRDALGCAGNADVQTPNVDRLAAEGVRAASAYSNTPLCTPSRGSLLTGAWPTDHRAVTNRLPIRSEGPSIARALGAEGYDCGYVGKWHLGGFPFVRHIPRGPERLGFDAFWAVWECSHTYSIARWYEDDPEPFLVENCYEPEVQTERALRWLGERSTESPFCLFVSYGPPHDPYRPLPPGKEDLYDPAALTLRPNCPEEFPQASLDRLHAAAGSGAGDWRLDVRRDLADYYTHVTALDEQVGRIVEHLRARDILDETIVVYTSDHGSMLGSHGLLWKQSPYEESIGIPLVIRAPGRVACGAVSSVPISVVDLAPTLLGMLGVPVPTEMQGCDLSAEIASGAGCSETLERAVYLSEAVAGGQAQMQGILPWRGIRTPDWTYARNLEGPWLLFNNNDDPWQLQNRVSDSGYANVRRELDHHLDELTAVADDPLYPPEELFEYLGLGIGWAALQRYWRELLSEMAAARAANDPDRLAKVMALVM